MLQGTPLDGVFNARRLRGFIPREGTELAAQQKKFEEELASRGSEAAEVVMPESVEPSQREGEQTADEDLENLELGMESSEWEIRGEVIGNGTGFFYDEGDEEEQEDEDIGIGARVAARRRGRLHTEGGQME
jgi:hypothetical protein